MEDVIEALIREACKLDDLYSQQGDGPSEQEVDRQHDILHQAVIRYRQNFRPDGVY